MDKMIVFTVLILVVVVMEVFFSWNVWIERRVGEYSAKDEDEVVSGQGLRF